MTNPNPWKQITISPGRYQHLDIGLDYDEDPNDTYPMLTFSPDLKKFEHWHIRLNKTQAKRLRDWLNKWLNDS